MALTTYTELKAAIATRLHRTDLTTAIVDYISLAEKRLNSVLYLTEQELEASLTATISSSAMTAPSDFGSPIALYLTTYLPRYEIEYRLPTEMQLYSSNGPAKNWTINGAAIRTDSPADIAYTYTLRYSLEYDIASTATNALLTRYPDTYFYGALIEACIDLRDKDGLAVNTMRYEQAIEECAYNSSKNRSIANLMTEVSMSGRTNIISGV